MAAIGCGRAAEGGCVLHCGSLMPAAAALIHPSFFSVQRLHGFRQVVQHVQLHVSNWAARVNSHIHGRPLIERPTKVNCCRPEGRDEVTTKATKPQPKANPPKQTNKKHQHKTKPQNQGVTGASSWANSCKR